MIPLVALIGARATRGRYIPDNRLSSKSQNGIQAATKTIQRRTLKRRACRRVDVARLHDINNITCIGKSRIGAKLLKRLKLHKTSVNYPYRLLHTQDLLTKSQRSKG